MKVLVVVASLDPRRGGTQAAATSMTRATQQAGVDHTVIAAGTPEARVRARVLTDQLEADGARVRQFGTLPWPPEAPDRWGISREGTQWVFGEASGFDLIHIHGVWGLSLVGALIAGRRRGVPVVVTPHESLTEFDINATARALRRRQKLALRALYMRWATLFVVTSELEASTSFPDESRRMVRVVGHPLVESKTQLPALQPRGTGRELRVGFLGRIHRKKNLDLLIGAVASLPEHVRLVVAGDGPLTEQMRDLIRHIGIETRTDWLGFVSPEQTSRFFDSIDVLAMPSMFESFGMSAAEAMLHGVPVIVSPSTGVAEVIDRCGGGLVAAADVAGTANAISQLDRARETLAELGATGQAAVAGEFNYARIGDELKEAYREAARGPGPFAPPLKPN